MSSHDEPFVIDNGPLGIDVGEVHAANASLFFQRAGADDWVRKFSQVDKIVVICKKNGAMGGVIETKIANISREPGKNLELTLAGGLPDSKLILSWGGLGSDELTIKPSGFAFSRNGRRLTHGALRVSHLTWFESADQTTATRFPATAESVHDSIFVGLYP
jgi:hypothetical protein